MKKHLKLINLIELAEKLGIFLASSLVRLAPIPAAIPQLVRVRALPRSDLKNLKKLSFFGFFRILIFILAIFSVLVFTGVECYAAGAVAKAVQTEATHGIFKFFMAMLGVLISSLAIFAGLKFYKKFMLKNNSKFDNIDYDKTLDSPRDFKEVINLFLDKTEK